MQHAENEVMDLTPFLEKWREQGKLTEERPEILTAILRSFFLMALHKREIGPGTKGRQKDRVV